jgi:hypothetical protein
MSTVLTHSGLTFDFARPSAAMVRLQDIAHGLSHACRFAGQCSTFYSVAQHAVAVSLLCPTLEALHHDDTEAYMGDMTRPLKDLVPQFKDLEWQVHSAIMQALGLSEEQSEDLKLADRRVYFLERQRLFSARYPIDCGGLEPAPASVLGAPLPPKAAKAMFLARHDQLVKARGRK